MPLPITYTPITKLQIPWDGKQGGTPCGTFEMDFMRCASRVGTIRARFDCRKELEDFRECAERKKQLERTKIMEKERERQKRAYLPPLGKDIPEQGY